MAGMKQPGPPRPKVNTSKDRAGERASAAAKAEAMAMAMINQQEPLPPKAIGGLRPPAGGPSRAAPPAVRQSGHDSNEASLPLCNASLERGRSIESQPGRAPSPQSSMGSAGGSASSSSPFQKPPLPPSASSSSNKPAGTDHNCQCVSEERETEEFNANSQKADRKDNVFLAAREFMSDELGKCVDEQEITYSWRKKSDKSLDAIPEIEAANGASCLGPEAASRRDAVSEIVGGGRVESSGPAVPRSNLKDAGEGVRFKADPPQTSHNRPVFSLPEMLGTTGSGSSDGAAVAAAGLLEEAAAKCAQQVLGAVTEHAELLEVADVKDFGSEPTGSCIPALRSWIHGKSSAEVTCLAVDDWQCSQARSFSSSWKDTSPVQLHGWSVGIVGDASFLKSSELLSLLRPNPTEALKNLIAADKDKTGESLSGNLLSLISAASCASQPAQTSCREMSLDDSQLLRLLSPSNDSSTSPDQLTSSMVTEMYVYISRLLCLRHNLRCTLNRAEDEYSRLCGTLGIATSDSQVEVAAAYRACCDKVGSGEGVEELLVSVKPLHDAYVSIVEVVNSSSICLDTVETEVVTTAQDDMKAALSCLAESAKRAEAGAKDLDDNRAQLNAEAQADATEAFKLAQTVGEGLLQISEDMGKLGDGVWESAMKVVECGLVLAARHWCSPCMPQLQNEALKCCANALHARQVAKSILQEYERASSSLQTTKMTLQMAKLIGNLDPETARMSRETAEEACSRLLRTLQPFTMCITAVAESGQQCSELASACIAGPVENVFLSGAKHALELLRSLNTEVIDLQHRVRANLSVDDLDDHDLLPVFAEELHRAVDAVEADFNAADEPDAAMSRSSKLDVALCEHLGFVELADKEFALPVDLRIALLRLNAHLDPDKTTAMLHQGVKARLAKTCESGASVLPGHMEKMKNAVVGVRLV
eukprot:gnl/MRDRNA2_/MRDRNA2_132097_c0_seq1.p1 gnl/MRDRNA2_/MRDRNA2_132097_c0~~gnl/MRDRNA2_/MRDRNA2_132097_c0_seq1.p1  ORF type:complete len:1035 (+),score=246.93 gnl/MRDRNA2_/MRDRNA2_132097_c0_seq1:305-3106(+)